MNELEEVERTNKKISNNRAYNLASASSRVEQQAAELTWQHATGKGSSIAKT